MSAGALSNKQFNTEQSMLSQGNADELTARVRGIQNMTSNVFRPSFSQDYTQVRTVPSSSGRTGSAVEEQEDQE